MLIAGIHNTGIISSCALLKDGEVVFASPEERFTRIKNSREFPMNALEEGLQSLNATINDIDLFSIGWNPAINIMDRYRAGFSQWAAYPGERFYTNPNHILPRLELSPQVATRQQFLDNAGGNKEFTYVTHHLAHMSLAYYMSGFKESAILSCDGYGEKSSLVYAQAQGADIKIIKEISFPHSIGQLYSAITQFLGFSPDGDEWKVMGAAAYGNSKIYAEKIRSLFYYVGDGEIKLDLNYFDHFNFDSADMFSSELESLLGSRRYHSEQLAQRHFDIAAALQKVVEDVLFQSVQWLKGATNTENICLTGGVHMNSVFNGKLATSSIFKNVYIPYAPDDSGNAIGAALWAHHNLDNIKKPTTYSPPQLTASPYLGKAYDNSFIEDTLNRLKIRYEKPDNLFHTVTDLIMDDNIIGWFQGRSEFGQRALGNRSIIADPRKAHMKDRINSAIKYRESFRPFAPSILEENVSDYFKVESDLSVPYMEKVISIKPEKHSEIPAVTHADGTGRLQTVNQILNPKYYELIKTFGNKTGIPILLNTSFNVNGEPIVESPVDAIRTFYSSGLDKLVLGNFIISK